MSQAAMTKRAEQIAAWNAENDARRAAGIFANNLAMGWSVGVAR